MTDETAKEPIKIFLDDQEKPFKVASPPLRFNFSTIQLPDGPHKLRIEASNGLAPPTIKEIPFFVRNGVALTVSGLQPQQTIGGQVELIVNAYAGNTEVDFEPRKAETPTPIPTWAWVLLLGVVAYTMFFVLNPTRPPRAAAGTMALVDFGHDTGERLYVDTCARCHGEDGGGRWNPDLGFWQVKRLRDDKDVVLDDTPYELLTRVVKGVEGTMMPAWGPRFTNEELVAVVNHVRSSWGHDASRIQLEHSKAPEGVENLEADLEAAMKKNDIDAILEACWPEPEAGSGDEDGRSRRGRKRCAVELHRVEDGQLDSTISEARVKQRWRDYLEKLCGEQNKGRILAFELKERRYHFDEATVEQDGSIVIGMGRIFLETEARRQRQPPATGRFIRVYQKQSSVWRLVFDFADIPMEVGCAVELDLPDTGPHGEDGTGPASGTTSTDGTGGPDGTGSAGGAALGYADIQALFREQAGEKAASANSAPHEQFWGLPYDEFVAFEFPVAYEEFGTKVKLLEPYRGGDSNLVRALEGRPLVVRLEDGGTEEREVARMPKGGRPFTPEAIGKIRAWIDAGAPEEAGKPSRFERPEGSGGATPDGASDGADPAAGDGEPSGSASIVDVGYAEIQALFETELRGKGASAAPHENFWELPYEEFVAFHFPVGWDEFETKVHLLRPYDPDKSNLLRGLRDETILVEMPDGSVEERDIARMPKGSRPFSEESIATIERWIAAGAPEHAGKPSALARPGAASAPDGGDEGDDEAEADEGEAPSDDEPPEDEAPPPGFPDPEDEEGPGDPSEEGAPGFPPPR